MNGVAYGLIGAAEVACNRGGRLPLGTGQQYLAAFLLSLNLLAFLFHTVLGWSDEKYALLRRVLARRQTFFEDIRALMRYMVFDSWDQLMDFMIRGLDLQPQVDTG